MKKAQLSLLNNPGLCPPPRVGAPEKKEIPRRTKPYGEIREREYVGRRAGTFPAGCGPSCPSLKGSRARRSELNRQTAPNDLASHQSDTGARSKAGGLGQIPDVPRPST